MRKSITDAVVIAADIRGKTTGASLYKVKPKQRCFPYTKKRTNPQQLPSPMSGTYMLFRTELTTPFSIEKNRNSSYYKELRFVSQTFFLNKFFRPIEFVCLSTISGIPFAK